MKEPKEAKAKRIAKRFLDDDAPCRVSNDVSPSGPTGYEARKVPKEELYKELKK